MRLNFRWYVDCTRTLADASPLLPLVLASCFLREFLESVLAAGGRFLHIPTGNARPLAAPAGKVAGGLTLDAAEASALPLLRAALDRCVGALRSGVRFSYVARAVRLVPGKCLRKRLRLVVCRNRLM